MIIIALCTGRVDGVEGQCAKRCELKFCSNVIHVYMCVFRIEYMDWFYSFIHCWDCVRFVCEIIPVQQVA